MMWNKKARNVRSGSYPLKNLKFLYDFAAEMNLTVGDLAARMGYQGSLYTTGSKRMT